MKPLIIALLIMLSEYTVKGQGTLLFLNRAGDVLDAPIFDSEGRRLEGTNNLAMLYASPLGGELHALPPAAPFYAGERAGYIDTGATGTNSYRAVPGVAPGAIALVQVRAWERRLGETYEEARKHRIGGYGESNMFLKDTGGCFQCPLGSPLLDLSSFSLRPITGIAVTDVFLREGEFSLQWVGNATEFRVQHKSDLSDEWQDLNGTVSDAGFTNEVAGSAEFYRIVGIDEGDVR